MKDVELAHVAETFKTPSFLFDVGAFQARFRSVREILGEGIGLCYAVKANPFLVPAAAEVAERLEVCSPGELDICKALGVDPEQIVFSGVNKTPESVAAAAQAGVGVMTAESLKHLALIEAEGARRGQVIDVLLRLNAGSQFGMSRQDLFSCIEGRDGYPHVCIRGIHYFVGTQRKNLKHQRKELGMLLALFDELQDRCGFAVQRLEYGPGLAVPLFEDDDFSDTLRPVRELADALQQVATRVELTVEMGRFFATECGTYLTAVNDLKSNEDVEYCIVDGGINHLAYAGQIMGMKAPIIENLSATDERRDATREYCICGSLCTTNDVLARGAVLPLLYEGDVLAFRNAGAYSVTEGVYLLLSRPLPRVLLRACDGSITMARDFVETSPINALGK